MSGTNVMQYCTLLRAAYVMSGTDAAYRGTLLGAYVVPAQVRAAKTAAEPAPLSAKSVPFAAGAGGRWRRTVARRRRFADGGGQAEGIRVGLRAVTE
eukprot:1500487-Rhodomonas_salina.2